MLGKEEDEVDKEDEGNKEEAHARVVHHHTQPNSLRIQEPGPGITSRRPRAWWSARLCIVTQTQTINTTF